MDNFAIIYWGWVNIRFCFRYDINTIFNTMSISYKYLNISWLAKPANCMLSCIAIVVLCTKITSTYTQRNRKSCCR